ncbi:transglycosylase domain-containing protein [Fodinicola feengrottensis]|uniref:Transglycosylase domain-containing protein n=1 Tax=Fodinicola feengrottensis TaxID=435914 RepID=A0ABN2FU65_9ACTN
MAAAAFPIVAVTGLSAKAGAQMFESLPSTLQTVQLPQTTKILTSDGKYVTSLYVQDRVAVPLSSVPVAVQHAVVATEDTRFYEHHGVDLKGIIRAFVANQQAGGASQGASTLTQQYVRQELILAAKTPQERQQATEVTIGRKLREARLAIALEKQYSKAQILERYLNIVYFGHGAYGIAQAAQRYFSKSVDQLTLSESAMLAGFIKSPTYYPAHPVPAEQRRDFVLQRMKDLNFVTAPQLADALAHPPTMHPYTTPNSCFDNGSITTGNNWGFSCDYLRIWAEQQPAFGATPEERWNNLQTGGYTIKLGLDSQMQAIAQDVVNSRGTSMDSRLAQGIVLIQPGTGQIKAMAINRLFGVPPQGSGPDRQSEYTQNPLLTGDPANGGRSTGYPSGSTFKMFTMLAALNQDKPLSTAFYAPQTYVSNVPATGDSSCDGKYCAQNASKGMTGRQNMWTGFGSSVNTYFVQLEQQVGAANVAQMAAKVGISFFPGAKTKAAPTGVNSLAQIVREGNGRAQRLSLTLGQGSDTWPLYMANAYATVAAHGKYCEPTPVQSITGPDGKALDVGNPKCSQVIPAGVADAATDAARCPIGQSPLTGSCSNGFGPTGGSVGDRLDPRPAAGKTGSTPGNKQLWFAGFVPQLAGASFSTDPDTPHGDYDQGDTRVANDIFSSTMARVTDGMDEQNFDAPPDDLVSGGIDDESANTGQDQNPTDPNNPNNPNKPKPHRSANPPTGHGAGFELPGGHLPPIQPPTFAVTGFNTSFARRRTTGRVT